VQKIHESAVLQSVHQIEGLYSQFPDSPLPCGQNRLLRAVDPQAVALQQLFTYDAACKTALYGTMGNPFPDACLHRPDGLLTGIFERCSEAHSQQEFLPAAGIICLFIHHFSFPVDKDS
jgi:hypothetical protein